MSDERRTKPRWITYLIYLCVATTLTTTVTLSRYMATISGSGTATVAMMTGGVSDVNLTIPSISPNGSEEILFDVVNYTGTGDNQMVSDVSQNYTITLLSTETKNLPLTYTLTKCDNKGNGAVLPVGTVLIPNQATIGKGTFPPTVAATHTYTLEITWAEDGNDNHLYSGKTEEIKIRIDAEQEASK